MTFVDIHSHYSRQASDILTVYNVLLGRQVDVELDNILCLSKGFHPWDLDKKTTGEIEELMGEVDWQRVSLIGECGFDKLISTDFEKQKKVFLKHIDLSENYQKPLIIHCVGYFNELFQIRKELRPTQRWIIHGFRGKPQLAEQALKSGFDLSFGEKYNEESVLVTPLSNLFVETDESEVNIETIYRNIAALKSCSEDNLKAGRELLEI